MTTYKSGEIPMVGDVLACEDTLGMGDNFQSAELPPTVAVEFLEEHHQTYVGFPFDVFPSVPGWSASRFRLIRRAGQQPGRGGEQHET